MPVEIKTIGRSGQISLGKQNAGRTVTVDEIEQGVWLVKTAQVIPDSELWLHTPEVKEAIDRGLAWAASHKAKETNLDEFERRVLRRLRRK